MQSTDVIPQPRTFAQYRQEQAENPRLTFGPDRAPLYADMRLPAVRSVMESQVGSTWRTIPWNSPTSWNGWIQRPDGIEYPAMTTSGGPAPYSRHSYDDLPVNGRFRDAAWLIPAAISNGIAMHSTFASTEHVSRTEALRVMKGFDRIIKHVTGVRL